MEKNVDKEFLDIRQTQLLNNLDDFICDKMLTLDIGTVDTLDSNVIKWLAEEIIKYEKGRAQ